MFDPALASATPYLARGAQLVHSRRWTGEWIDDAIHHRQRAPLRREVDVRQASAFSRSDIWRHPSGRHLASRHPRVIPSRPATRGGEWSEGVWAALNIGILRVDEGKARKGKIMLYKNDVIKNARVKYEEYTNYKGNTVSATAQGEDCKCSNICFDRVPVGDRREILESFRLLASKNIQNAYLQRRIGICSIEQRRSRRADKHKPKSCSFKYSVDSSSEKEESPKDKRRLNTSGNALPDSTVVSVKEHIKSFPTKIYHYSGKKKTKYRTLNVKCKFYLKIFREHFDLSFGRPQIDTCCKCEGLRIKIKSPSPNDAAKRVVARVKRRAKKLYAKVQAVKSKCLDDDPVVVISMDFMQNLQLPVIPVQKQLTYNVFNIQNIGQNNSKCYTYHESTAKKSANEVAYFKLDYINNETPTNAKHFHRWLFWAEPQQYNSPSLHIAIGSTGRFTTMTHYFHIRGHYNSPSLHIAIGSTGRFTTMTHYFHIRGHYNSPSLHIAIGSTGRFTTMTHYFHIRGHYNSPSLHIAIGSTGRFTTMTHYFYIRGYYNSPSLHIAIGSTGRFTTMTHYFHIRGHSFLPNDRDLAMAKRVFIPLEYTEMLIAASKHLTFTVKMVDTSDILDCKVWAHGLFKNNCLSLESSVRNIPRHEKQPFVILKASRRCQDCNLVERLARRGDEASCA
ncbi:hypothetical protein PR048_020385 [Dryococelus australis]|uniref:Uncharacterized protein n=1 Tax=Dryococelus australis TaxID=614101 RepID=A0ABQ9H6A0_9NEOP|nr:hypothetical protein PR048_020385 [Dryococelus australis]